MSPGAGGVFMGAAILLGGMVAVGVATGVTITPQAPSPSAVAAPAGDQAILDPAPRDSLVARGGLFRAGRRPAPTAFDPLGAQAVGVPVEPAPTVFLVGVALGVERSAIVRGIPGSESAVVMAEGEERAGLRLLRIEAARVLVAWRGDSVWIALPSEGGRE